MGDVSIADAIVKGNYMVHFILLYFIATLTILTFFQFRYYK